MNRWVFGYGSLIWNPGFAHLSARPALLHGAHRALSVYSHRHRGTPQKPGLVFGLSRGGSCRGVAFEVASSEWDEVYAYLLAREQDRGVYREAVRTVELDDGPSVRALAFLVNEHHPQYAGRLDLTAQLRFIAQGEGESGPNAEYVRRTAEHLLTLGINDRALMKLVKALDADTALLVESA